MIVNVSDLYDGLHEMAVLAANLFGLDEETEPTIGDFMDQLEIELFLPACARRATMIARQDVDPDDVAGMIRLREIDGSIRPGAAGRYHGHAFDSGAGGEVSNQVLAANLMPRGRQDVELIVVLD
jgi:hypothetical protein